MRYSFGLHTVILRLNWLLRSTPFCYHTARKLLGTLVCLHQVQTYGQAWLGKMDQDDQGLGGPDPREHLVRCSDGSGCSGV
jgi:hypothetical protein